MLPDWKIWECDGSKYVLFERQDIIADSLKSSGVFGGDIIKISSLLCERINAPLVLDIGANLGSYAIPMGKFLKERGGELHAFEPQRIPFYQLCANVILNQLSNIFVRNIALGKQDSTVEIYESDVGMWNSGAYSLIKEYRQAENIDSHLTDETTTVGLLTLDGMVFSRPVNLIKMDVEGYEINVVEGGQRFLEENNFPYIIFEAWDSAWFLEQKNTLLQKFINIGYEIVQIDRTNFLAQHVGSYLKIQITDIDGSRKVSLI